MPETLGIEKWVFERRIEALGIEEFLFKGPGMAALGIAALRITESAESMPKCLRLLASRFLASRSFCLRLLARRLLVLRLFASYVRGS